MENKSQAIELKGIARSLTKLGVKDGQCEDIVNLRFKDGSWRVSDDGKHVYTLPDNYTQLYVHTNVYHHLLGVLNGKLWYFADIDNDGETFTPLDKPVEVCEVATNDLDISQIGNIIIVTVNDSICYCIFGDNKYTKLNINLSGEPTDRTELLGLHLNLSSEYTGKSAVVISTDVKNSCGVTYKDGSITIQSGLTREYLRNTFVSGMNQIKERNLFLKPFLALGAIKLYDGTWIAATNPVYLFHDEICLGQKKVNTKEKGIQDTLGDYTREKAYVGTTGEDGLSPYIFLDNASCTNVKEYITPMVSCGDCYKFNGGETTRPLSFIFRGSEIIYTLTHDFESNDIIKGFGIFATPEATFYEEEEGVDLSGRILSTKILDNTYGVVGYCPIRKTDEAIIRQLMSSNFYLLEEFTGSFKAGSYKLDLLNKSKGFLKDLVLNEKLPNEAFEKKTYAPNVSYVYNNRFHVANYKSLQSHGYPIDFFHLSNHSVKLESGSYLKGKVIPNLKENEGVQYKRDSYYFADHMDDNEVNEYLRMAIRYGTCFAAISVVIETQEKVQRLVKYIAPYNKSADNEYDIGGYYAYFVESLSPLLTFPDARARSMEIKVISLYEDKVYVYSNNFELTPHPYLNIAYYIDKGLEPIHFTNSQTFEVDDFLGGEQDVLVFCRPSKELNIYELYCNALKVSKTNNPFSFPYTTTYQVGSSEIIAMMSNAVAVGTGQTGAAPLYVFCKDGIYALLVDSSGEMAYTNARIIARDVCNNAKSVTPVDDGIVFTTDRGLMSISGSEVLELGQIVEGDVFDIVNRTYIDVDGITKEDKAKKIMFNSFTKYQLGALPQGLLDNADFLTFLKGSIVNYNHNERELMVSNPQYSYTYVMDRYGNWSRRNYKAIEYVNNYPTSYRVNGGELYKLDTDDGVSTNNGMYLLSQVIKLGTIAFKQAYRLVVRGYFETPDVEHQLGCYCFGSYDGRKWGLLGWNEKGGKFTDIGCKISRNDVKFLRLCLAGKLNKDSRIDFVEVSSDGSILNTKVR